MPGSTRRTYLHERSAAVITKQKVGHQRRVGGRAGTEIEIEKTVVVEITEVRSHCCHTTVKACLLCHIRESTVSDVAVEFHGVALAFQSNIRPYPLAAGKEIASHE